MEGEVSEPQPSRLETARDTAIEKGAERRRKTSERISRLFSGIREKVTKGIDFVWGSEEYGKEVVEIGKEKAGEARDAVVEAGVRTWESVVDTKDRFVQRVTDAKDRLVTRYEQTKDATEAKLVDLSKRAADWGATKIAEPVIDRLQKIYEMPVDIRKWHVEKAVDVKVKKQETRTQLAQEKGNVRIQALQEEIARIQEAIVTQVDINNSLGNSALARKREVNEKVVTRRKQAVNKFAKMRAVVAALKARD